MSISAKIVAITQPQLEGIASPEEFVVYTARVSNPSNQLNMLTKDKLIDYLIRNKHWSPFEQVSVTVELHVPRDIGRQALRHGSFKWQEFSQRYALATEFEPRECRMQDPKNRQSSLPVEDSTVADWWRMVQLAHIHDIEATYKEAIEKGIAKEVARAILPEGLTMSVMYMTGNLRSFIHYCQVRLDPTTQKEHRELASHIFEALRPHFPNIMRGMDYAQVVA